MIFIARIATDLDVRSSSLGVGLGLGVAEP
jgi:hypothetical protein